MSGFGGDQEGDLALAERLAWQAGELLLGLRRGSGSGDALGRAGDQASQDFIAHGLRRARPADALLSEEAPDDRARLGARRVWIVDPLDGTREFSRPGRSDWAVQVALWVRDQGIAAAAVALPALGELHSSGGTFRPLLDRGPGPHTPDMAASLRVDDQELVVVASESRTPELAGPVAQALGARLVLMGSAGAKAMAVVTGRADAYLHSGGQWEWDSAAPVGVAQALGFHASRLDGSPLVYNQERPWLPDLLICRSELARTLLDLVGRLGGDGSLGP